MAESAPTPDQVLEIIFKAMRKPPKEAGPARRPRSIGLPARALVDALAAQLAEIHVAPIEQQPPEGFQEVIQMFEQQFGGDEPEHPGLLTVKGATPALIGSLPENLANTVKISAKFGTGTENLLEKIQTVCGVSGFDLKTAVCFTLRQENLLKKLQKAVSKQQALSIITELLKAPLSV
jgi:hypothetical protein